MLRLKFFNENVTPMMSRNYFLFFSDTSRPLALPHRAEMPRPLILVSEDHREARVTDMARVEVITIGAGGPAEARGETPGLRCRAGPEVSRPQVTAKTGEAGLHPTLEARGETSTRVTPHFPHFLTVLLVIDLGG